MTKASMDNAKKNKADEYYTRLCDIEDEMKHYKHHFKDKVVYCNCDDPYESNFFKYFALNFNHLGLKRLIATCYGESSVAGRQLSLFEDYKAPVPKEIVKTRRAFKIDINRDDPKGLCNLSDYESLLNQKGVVERLKGNGDFRSDECIALLEQADIVVTNPPFSLFREYVAQLMKYGKKFLVIGSCTAIGYRDIFPLLKNNDMWLGTGYVKQFVKPDGTTQKFGNIQWFTNLDIKKRHEELFLTSKYDPEHYLRYDNYDAIDVGKVIDIPRDYDGTMGVPITFMDKYSPEQFEIVALMSGAKGDCLVNGNDGNAKFTINGKAMFSRILIRRKKQ